MKKTHFLTAIAFALAASASTVHAHDDAYLDTQKAPHGGQLRMAGLYHLELVLDNSSPAIADKPVVVYVTDHAGQKISTANATAKATVALVPDGDNRLKGVGRFASTPDMKAVITLTAKGQPPETARFTPLAAMQDEHMDHSKH